MTSAPRPSLFDSFNARNLAPSEVARTFVAPDYFGRLLGQHHTLILGPRGSGKTTLLKMLQQEALDTWNSPEAGDARRRVTYNSVYIATDVSWGRQIASLGAPILETPHSQLFTTAAFTTQILLSLLHSVVYLNEKRCAGVLDEDAEAAAVEEIAKTWLVDDGPVSFRSLKYALGRRLARIHDFASQERYRDAANRPARLAEDPVLHLSFTSTASFAIDVLNDVFSLQDSRWAFLFDELELAPPAIRETLLRSLRSIDERFIFKLSLVPFGNDLNMFQDALAASPGQDFEIIPLWYSRKEDGFDFCTSLWESMLRDRGLPNLPPDEVLGQSLSTTPASEWKDSGTAYRKGTSLYKRFDNLRKKDASFDAFLKQQNINVDSLDAVGSSKRAAIVRKATTLVSHREALLETWVDESQSTLRSRKATELYTGAGALFAITEGNPRWFKGIVGPLIESLNDSNARVSRSSQNELVIRAIRRFRALLRTIPRDDTEGDEGRGLLSLVDRIGKYMFDRVVRDRFTIDPVGTVIVDSRASDELLQSLGSAINAGALVSVNALETPWSSLRGKRLRLSYLLAAHYRTLLRLERDVALSSVLGREADTDRSKDDDGTLF
jgi:hypothetical protein